MRTSAPFQDRAEAGRELAARLKGFLGREDALVLALPRGGVPVGFEIARKLRLPLHVLLAHKLGVPGHEEQAFGAVAAEGGVYLDWEVIRAAGVTPAQITVAIDTTRQNMKRRAERYSPDGKQPEVLGKIVILVDDGAATGASLLAGLKAMKKLQPAQLVVAVSVGSEAVCALLERDADLVIALERPRGFYAIPNFYRDFRQLTDDDVVKLLEAAKRWVR